MTTRRTFCAGVAIAIAGCGDPSRLDVGGITGDPDLEPRPHVDLAGVDLRPAGDMARDPKDCKAGTSAGAASAITQAAPVYVASLKAYVCRDDAGIYAMSSLCTHLSCKLVHQPTQFYCNCHGATFDLNGENPTAPAVAALPHYAACVDEHGDVQVDASTIVPASTRG